MKIYNLLTFGLIASVFSSCSYFDRFENKAAQINRYENVSLSLIHENRLLNARIDRLKYQISKLESKNSFLSIKLDKVSSNSRSRKIASVPVLVPKNDMVKDDVYNWSSSDLLKIARVEFDKKNYEKSSQHFYSFYSKYSNDERINDEFLFEAGIAAFESKVHYDWSNTLFSNLITTYPNSKYFRGAKLWRGLTYLKEGKNSEFFKTVEEFRKKYRNTDEWNILSRNYEKMVQRYKQ